MSEPPATSQDRIRALPIWRGPISIEPMKGGLSNESWLVKDGSGQFVVRFGKDYGFHHVSREREIITARAAHAAGFAPEVRYSAPGVMVTRYLGARTYTGEDVRADIDAIAETVRRFHQEMPKHVSGAGFMFWPFHVVRDYARTLEAGNSRMAHALPGYVALAEELEAAQTPLPIVFGHNDLLPANFLHDGRRLWLIDFEYAGFSTAMFDLAGIASNASMNDAESKNLLAIYFGAEPSAEILHSHAAMQCASLLREAMWSMVSELYLTAPGANYVAYTDENLSKLAAALAAYREKYGKT